MVEPREGVETFFALVKEIKNFLQEKNPKLLTGNGESALMQLSNDAWLLDLAFLVDITQHFNTSCIRLQGYGQLLPDLFNTVTAFRRKLNLFRLQLSTGNMMHFEYMSSLLLEQKLI